MVATPDWTKPANGQPAPTPEPPSVPATSDSHEYVRWVQSTLNQVMGLRLPVDGIIGPETRSAIRDFQRREGLPVDGIVGPETKQALIAARRGPPPAPSDAPPAEEEQFLGSVGGYFTRPRRYPSRKRAQRLRRSQPRAHVNRSSREYIRWVQGSLNKILGLQLEVDGILGPLTRSAIRGFQQKYGLAVDGVVGPQTEGALIRAGAGNPPGSRAPSRTPPPAPPPPPTSARGLRQKVAQLAVQEWRRWGQGTTKECEPGIRSVLEDYWRTGVGFVPSQSNYCSRVAWSAAFISWIMRQAGAGSAFRYSSAHTDYVSEAKRNRLANNSNPFKAYRIAEVAPRVGDLVCVERKGSNGNWSGVNYDNVDQGFRASHCDIVTEVRPGEIIAIGGNVSDSVSDKTIKTDSNGRVRGPRYYAVVRVGA